MNAFLKLFSWKRRKIVYLHDGADWALEWVAKGIAKHLHHNRCFDFRIATSLENLAPGSIVHFGNRYDFFQHDPAMIGSRFRAVVTWLHGQYNSEEFRGLFERLKESIPYVAMIVTSCRDSENELLQAGIPKEKIVVIPLGVDLELFNVGERVNSRPEMRENLGFSDADFVVGSFQKDGSGWGDGMEPKHVKGPDILVQVLDELNKMIPNLKVLLTGPSRGYVKKELDSRGIRWIHRLVDRYQEMPVYYSALDAYLISSRVEGGPLSLPESWAMQVPLVSTRMGMPRDWLENDKNGFVYETTDIMGMAERLATIAADGEAVRSIVETALADVQTLDWGTIASQYVNEVYLKI